ncbi:hypothetical protein SAMN06265182_0284 [Persephonella hydrogeniphila]|uniref:Uncharacterized protein n=1 Tax=Persephonella hydrogeniphila TaxID=198703 RepID=A0A285N0T5_9AQUI|nr:hypothetical protein SAMN06265182_0284 [Persephonella hydrogeniphila]
MKQLRKLLKNYGVGLDYFKPDNDYWNDASVTYAERKVLEENKEYLSKEDLELLKEYDLKAIELYEKYKELNTDTVKDWLFDIAKIAKVNLSAQLK